MLVHADPRISAAVTTAVLHLPAGWCAAAGLAGSGSASGLPPGRDHLLGAMGVPEDPLVI